MSVQSAESRGQVPQVARDLITRFYDILVELPPPGTVYRGRDLPEELKHRTKSLKQAEIIHEVDTIVDHASVPIWETDERAYAAIEAYEPAGSCMPCGHRGFRNLGDEGYTCGDEDCGARFGRETARRCLEG